MERELRDTHLEYRRRTGEIVSIFHWYKVKERELFPLTHAVSCVHDGRPLVTTAGAGDGAAVAIGCEASEVDYYLAICG